MAALDALIIHETDNVATALRDLIAGEHITLSAGNKTYVIKVQNDIPIFHKLALTEIHQGEKVFKYGETIGEATANIAVGEHVHTQNLTTLRG